MGLNFIDLYDRAAQSVDFIDELPRSPVGKVLKRELRKQYWDNREVKI